VQQRQVAAQRRHGSSPAAATPRGWPRTRRSPTAPVGHEPQPLRAGERVHVPHRHAGPHHQGPPARTQPTRSAGHPPLERLGPLVQQPVDRLPAQPFGLQPVPRGPGARRVDRSRSGGGRWRASSPRGRRVRRREARGPGRPAAGGSTRTWGMDSSSQAVRALLVGAPPTRTARLGRWAAANRGAGPGRRRWRSRRCRGGPRTVGRPAPASRLAAANASTAARSRSAPHRRPAAPWVGPDRLGQLGHVVGGRRPHPGRRHRPRRAAGPAPIGSAGQARLALHRGRDQRVGKGEVEVHRSRRGPVASAQALLASERQ
jgi:hypothetical protein